MIDTASETLVPVNEVPRLLPCRSTGKKIHISAIYRWAQRGIRGVRLDVVRIGGTSYTSREALQRFAEGISSQPGHDDDTPTPRARQREVELAAKRVKELLGRRSSTRKADAAAS